MAMALPTRRRGPQTKLSDAQLLNRRDQLIQAFEGAWAQIGLKLQKCKHSVDLIDIFSPLLNSCASEVFSIFCCPSEEPVTGATVRAIRIHLRALTKPIYIVDESQRRISQQLQQIDRALGQVSEANLEIVRQEQEKLLTEAKETDCQSRELAAKEKILREELQKLEPSFARQEIFGFLTSERYELNPLSLANAASNLPYSGWRQSMKRTAGVPSQSANGLDYQIFKAVRFLTGSVDNESATAFVAGFRAGVSSLPSRHKLAKKELAKNWHFLESAIRESYKTMTLPEELHFAITALYFKHFHSATEVELVVAENRKIRLARKAAVPKQTSS